MNNKDNNNKDFNEKIKEITKSENNIFENEVKLFNNEKNNSLDDKHNVDKNINSLNKIAKGVVGDAIKKVQLMAGEIERINKKNLSDLSTLKEVDVKPSDYAKELAFFMYAEDKNLSQEKILKILNNPNQRLQVFPDNFKNRVIVKDEQGVAHQLTIVSVVDSDNNMAFVPIMLKNPLTPDGAQIKFSTSAMDNAIEEFRNKFQYGKDCVMTTSFRSQDNVLLPLAEMRLALKLKKYQTLDDDKLREKSVFEKPVFEKDIEVKNPRPRRKM